MSRNKLLSRRDALQLMAAATAAGAVGLRSVSAAASDVGVMVPGKGWVEAGEGNCQGDGTPLQFIPKSKPDPDPLKDELKKYAICPYCGMNRTKWHHSRHLVQYSDNLVDGTCSIHCLALSLSLNLDRGPKAIYAADFGADGKVKPMVNVDECNYLIGSKLKGTMSMVSKMAFKSIDQAKEAQSKNGGKLGTFDDALKTIFLNIAEDTVMIRKRRAKKRQMMMSKK